MKTVDALRGRIAQQVREAIADGTLPPGGRINESRLSVDLGVSRTPLREALFSLESLGMLAADPPRGFFVAPLTAREARELYPIGRALDVLAVRSARRFSKTTLDRLEVINRRFRAAKNQPEKARQLDREFHLALIEACPNRRLLAMLDGVQAAMERYERLYMSDARDVERSAREHADVIRALRAGDVEAAVSVLSETWEYSLERLLLALGENP